MGIPVLILGETGSGKSTSLRNFEQGGITVLNVACKPLPFKKKLDVWNIKNDIDRFDQITAILKRNKSKRYVIDDSQYLMAFFMFDRAKELGYGKFTECALKFEKLIECVVQNTSDDTIVYFLHHIETTEQGKVKAKTSGKMLDNQLTLEGLFTIVLLAETDGKTHWFTTQSDGSATTKSPMGMFDLKIDNDLKFVDNAIREYYGFNESEENVNGKN